MINVDDIYDFDASEDVLNSKVNILIEAIQSFPESVDYLEQFLRGCEVHLSLSLKSSKKVIEERNSELFKVDQICYAESISVLLLLCYEEGDLFNQISSVIQKMNLRIDTSYLKFPY